jgi:hypothetical protein
MAGAEQIQGYADPFRSRLQVKIFNKNKYYWIENQVK